MRAVVFGSGPNPTATVPDHLVVVGLHPLGAADRVDELIPHDGRRSLAVGAERDPGFTLQHLVLVLLPDEGPDVRQRRHVALHFADVLVLLGVLDPTGHDALHAKILDTLLGDDHVVGNAGGFRDIVLEQTMRHDDVGARQSVLPTDGGDCELATVHHDLEAKGVDVRASIALASCVQHHRLE